MWKAFYFEKILQLVDFNFFDMMLISVLEQYDEENFFKVV